MRGFAGPISFHFISQAYPPDSFEVLSFTGDESISQPYEFNINLATRLTSADPLEILNRPATFVIRQGRREFPYHGMVINIDQINQIKDYAFYQVVLVPRLYRLNMIRHNQVFLNKTIPEILEDLLNEAGLTALDYEFRLQGDSSLYWTWEMVCQYNQSNFDFFSFWAESMGLYYFFEQGRLQEKVIVTDTNLVHKPFEGQPFPAPDRDFVRQAAPPDSSLKDEKTLVFAPPSGLGHSRAHETIFHFRRRQRLVPQAVKVKDYNYRKPSLDLNVVRKAYHHGAALKGGLDRGAVYGNLPAKNLDAAIDSDPIDIYADPVHYDTPEDGRRLAAIRAEELSCQETIHTGVSRCGLLRPGFTFKLDGHFQDDFNRKYLTTRVGHSGHQAGRLNPDLDKTISDEGGGPLHLLSTRLKRIFFTRKNKPAYENRFVAMPAEVQFRPERKTEPSRIWGTLSAIVDGAASGKYPEIDGEGRYKVILPFDSSGRKGLKASAWIRMSQPTGGIKQGLHFPLRPGTEVLLSFLGGDPNRPIIVGAVPNAENPSIITSANLTRGGIQSESGNQIVFNDASGSEYIALRSADGSSQIGLASSLPGSGETSDAGTNDNGVGDSSVSSSGVDSYSLKSSVSTMDDVNDDGPPYTFTVIYSGDGGGTVTGDKEGPVSSGFQKVLDSGEQITLTAKAHDDSSFEGWSGDGGEPSDESEDSSKITYTMNSNKTAVANFKKNGNYKLTINIVGQGRVDLTPQGSGLGDDSFEYEPDKEVRLNAWPDADNNWSFKQWSGDMGGNTADGDLENSTIEVKMDKERTITANFDNPSSSYPNYWEYITGDAWGVYWGAKNNILGGSNTNVTMGSSNTVFVGASNSLSLSNKFSLSAGMSTSLNLGLAANYNWSDSITYSKGRSFRFGDSVNLSPDNTFRASGGKKKDNKFAKRAKTLAIISSIMSGLGSVTSSTGTLLLSSSLDSDSYMSKENTGDWVAPMGVGISSTVVGAASILTAAGLLAGALKKHEKAPNTAEMFLDDKGMRLIVQPPEASDKPKIQMEVKNNTGEILKTSKQKNIILLEEDPRNTVHKHTRNSSIVMKDIYIRLGATKKYQSNNNSKKSKIDVTNNGILLKRSIVEDLDEIPRETAKIKLVKSVKILSNETGIKVSDKEIKLSLNLDEDNHNNFLHISGSKKSLILKFDNSSIELKKDGINFSIGNSKDMLKVDGNGHLYWA